METTKETQWCHGNDKLAFKAYNIRNLLVSSVHIGSFVLAIVELRCLDVSNGPSKFIRVSYRHFEHLTFFLISTDKKKEKKVYWMEAFHVRCQSALDVLSDKTVEELIEEL
jgi:hypothetical protein